jgi:hypothetical protein
VPPNDPDTLGHAIDAVTSPLVPFARNAAHVGPQLVPQFTPEAIAVRMEHNLARTAGLITHPEGLDPLHPATEEEEVQEVYEQEPVQEQQQEPEA